MKMATGVIHVMCDGTVSRSHFTCNRHVDVQCLINITASSLLARLHKGFHSLVGNLKEHSTLIHMAHAHTV